MATLVAAALGLGIGRTELWPPDETRVAEISREMLVEGTWSVPRLNGRPFLEEPPLFYWLQAAAYRVAGGPSAVAARIPAALSAVAVLPAAIILGRLAGASVGLTVLALCTAPEFWWMARSGTPDTALAATTSLALVLFLLAWRSGRASLLAAATICAAVAFWLKSLLGVGLATLTVATFVGWKGRGRLRWRDLLIAALALALAAGVWLVVLWRAEGPGAVTFFVVTNHLGRLLGAPNQGHVRSVFYYLPEMAVGLFPWSLALPASFAAAWKERDEPARCFALLWAATMLLALSASTSKNAHYLLPAYPALAVLVAAWWPGEEGRIAALTQRLFAFGVVVVCPVLALVVLSLDVQAIMRGGPIRAGTFGNPTPVWAWLATALFTMLGIAFLAARRSLRADRAATLAGASALLLHVIIATIVLPRFDVFCSARIWGEDMAKDAARGYRVVAFGFSNREALSPFMFYAGHRIEEIASERELTELLKEGHVYALVRYDAYARLTGLLRELPSTPGEVGRLRFVVIHDHARVSTDVRQIARTM